MISEGVLDFNPFFFFWGILRLIFISLQPVFLFYVKSRYPISSALIANE